MIKNDILDKYFKIIDSTNTILPLGKVVEVNGFTIISEGPPDTAIKDICRIEKENGEYIYCEVIGFRGKHLILMPFGSPDGIFPNANVHNTNQKIRILVSEKMIGRVFDGLGNPIDGEFPIYEGEYREADNSPPNPMDRDPIKSILVTGIKAIDGLLTVGKGQRIGIFAGTGVGKSTLLGMIARYTKADINVICLVGERGREVREFIERDLGREGIQRSIVIVATSDKSALEKMYAAYFATSIAEYFRDQGKDVNLFMDSVTRFCMALREIGIAVGDPLGPGGYPQSTWYRLSRLVERSGVGKRGTITGFYSVLVEADDMNDPVADATRGILDGHIILSRRLAHKNHYPAIEITESISRVMPNIITEEHLSIASKIKSLLAVYQQNEDLIQLGAYVRGTNPELDLAIEKINKINDFLKQPITKGYTFEETLYQLKEILK
ncbi:MAG: flagellum-specific ATP synthase FliI [Leptospiraceae bacterium]|nr:MAG: flagellum-specific ATP synthase FliI [Leptospiraceae bacterium]